jgi:CcmD family protein
MSGIEYMFVAFVVIWLGFFLYVFSLAQRQKGVEKDLAMIEAMLEDERGEKIAP